MRLCLPRMPPEGKRKMNIRGTSFLLLWDKQCQALLVFGSLRNCLRGLEIYYLLIVSAVLAFRPCFPGGPAKCKRPKSTADAAPALFSSPASFVEACLLWKQKPRFHSAKTDNRPLISSCNVWGPREAVERDQGRVTGAISGKDRNFFPPVTQPLLGSTVWIALVCLLFFLFFFLCVCFYLNIFEYMIIPLKKGLWVTRWKGHFFLTRSSFFFFFFW